MGDKDKTKQETAKRAFNWKYIAGAAALIIILLNIFWSTMESTVQSKITEAMAKEKESMMEEFKSDLAAFEARAAEAEKDNIDLEAVKAEIASLKLAGEGFEKKLNALIKAEELRLADIEKSAAGQKAYVDELKSLIGGSAK